MNNQEEILPVSIYQYAIDIVAGSFHSIAICQDGIYVWGKADSCNLGLDSKQEIIQSPQYIQIQVENACAGHQHSFAWRNNEVYCWGSNKDYKLGLQQPTQYQLTKSEIFTQAIEAGMQLESIACGDSHSLAVQITAHSYQIFAWGESKNYQLALETQGVVPQPIMIQFNQSVKHLYSRSDYSFIITQEGNCYSWGTNLFGRLGFSNTIKNQKFPSQIQFSSKIKSVAMGKYHCVAISEQNQAYAWGHGLHGQLGLNQIISETTPKKVPLNQEVVQACCGEYHSILITKRGDLLSCGTNAYFALGHNNIDIKKRCKQFQKIKLNSIIYVKKIVCGNRHNLLLSKDGKIYSWGCNKNGQLGRIVGQRIQMNNIKRQLYKDTQKSIKNYKQLSLGSNKSVISSSPFSEIKQSFSPQNRENNDQQRIKASLKILDWKKRYQKFKIQQQKHQKQFMKQLEEILKQVK